MRNFWSTPVFSLHLLIFNLLPRALWAMAQYSLWALTILPASLARILVAVEAIRLMGYTLPPKEFRVRRSFSWQMAMVLLFTALATISIGGHVPATGIPQYAYAVRWSTELLAFGALSGTALLAWSLPIEKMLPGVFGHACLLAVYNGSLALGDAMRPATHKEFLLLDSIALAVQGACLAIWLCGLCAPLGPRIRPEIGSVKS